MYILRTWTSVTNGTNCSVELYGLLLRDHIVLFAGTKNPSFYGVSWMYWYGDWLSFLSSPSSPTPSEVAR